MDNAQYLWHVTLQTGHTRRSYRHEVADDVVQVCRDLLARALREPAEIPGMSLLMTAESSRRRLLVPVQTQNGVPVVTIGIARHSAVGAPLWRLLVETAELPVHPSVERCPPEPWCAARIERGITTLSSEQIMALGDFERCIAWAWMGSRGAAVLRTSP